MTLRPPRRLVQASLATACLAGLVAGSPGARAEADEWTVSLGAFYRGLSTHDATAGAGYINALGAAGAFRYGLDDFWQLGGSLHAGIALGTPPGASGASSIGFLGTASVELHWVVDIVTWVPYLTLSAGALARAGGPTDGVRLDALVGVGGGIDYRPDRSWSVGLVARAEFPVTDLARTPVTYFATLTWSTYFE